MFETKTWKDRVTEYPNRRLMVNNDTSETAIVTLSRSEGVITEQGDAFSAENMNDLEGRIEDECTAIEQSMANVQTTSIASVAFAVGSYLIYDGQFYRVTQAISAGGTIIPGTNCVATTIADSLKSSINTVNTTITNITNTLDDVSTQTIQNTDEIAQLDISKPDFDSTAKYATLNFVNGYATYTTDLSSRTRKTDTFPGVLINGIETEDIFVGTLVNGVATAFTVKIYCLTTPNLTGSRKIGINLIGNFN